MLALAGLPCDKRHTMNRRVVCLVSLSALSLLASCTSPRIATPTDLAPLADEIAVTDRSRASGMLANETFGMGPNKVTRVHRGATSSSSSSFLGKESSDSQSYYDFDMTTPVGVYKGSCGVRAFSEETHLGNWVIGGSGAEVLDCNCGGAGEGVTRAYVELAPQSRGALVARGGGAAPLKPLGAGSAFSAMPIGWEAGENPPIGAVELSHPGRVWINRTLPAGEQADVACLFGGLLLYHPNSGPH